MLQVNVSSVTFHSFIKMKQRNENHEFRGYRRRSKVDDRLKFPKFRSANRQTIKGYTNFQMTHTLHTLTLAHALGKLTLGGI